MGLSIQQQLLINRSIRNGEGGIDQMKRANSLISEMKTTIPDFSEHSAVYTQLARYLAKDEDCSTEDIINAYNSIKDSLKSNGRESNDKDVLTVFNLFKIMVNDVQIHPLYNNADLEAGDIIRIRPHSIHSMIGTAEEGISNLLLIFI